MSFTGIYRIGDKVIEITSLYMDVHEYCMDYKSDGKADICVKISESDIEHEREKSEGVDIAQGKGVMQWKDGYLEELAVYRKIAEKMPEYDTFLMHGSVVSVDGQGYMFTAKSGTGKSTHTRLWKELLGDRAVMVNDDKPLIKVSDSGVTVYGTPYNGKHHLGNNIVVPLKCICILERAKENHIRQIDRSQAYHILLQQSYRPSDIAMLAKTLSLIDEMSDKVKFYRLGCNMDISAAQLAFRVMNN